MTVLESPKSFLDSVKKTVGNLLKGSKGILKDLEKKRLRNQSQPLRGKDWALVIATVFPLVMLVILAFYGVLSPSSGLYSVFGNAFEEPGKSLSASLIYAITAPAILLAGISPALVALHSYAWWAPKQVILWVQLLIAAAPFIFSAWKFYQLLGILATSLGRSVVATVGAAIIPAVILYSIHYIYYAKKEDEANLSAYAMRIASLLSGVGLVSLVFGILFTHTLFVPGFMFFTGALSMLNVMTLILSLRLGDWIDLRFPDIAVNKGPGATYNRLLNTLITYAAAFLGLTVLLCAFGMVMSGKLTINNLLGVVGSAFSGLGLKNSSVPVPTPSS